MNLSEICILVSIVAYLGLVLYVGFRFAKKNESASDFYLGGRKLGPLVTAMSAEASDMSSYLLMGLPGLAYFAGLAEVTWTVIGLAIGTYLNWLFTAKRLRRYTQVTETYTLPQFFSTRFRDKNNILCIIAALVIIVFFIPYTASGFKACGTLFESLFGANYYVAMIISAVVIVGYTATGGFLAASTTDFIQSIMMTTAIVFVLIFSTIKAGGPAAVLENAKSLPGFFTLFQNSAYDTETAVRTATPFGFFSIITTLSWGLGYFGMPHILLRFMAIEDEKKLSLSRRVASIWVVIAMGIAVLIGLVGNALSSQEYVKTLTTSSEAETIIVEISHKISQTGSGVVLVVLALMAGLIMAGILASTMSTADSQLLAASSSVSQNLIREGFKIKSSDKVNMIIARVTVIVIAIIGVILAANRESNVFKVVSFAWAGFGAAFGPLMLCSLFWKRTNLPGAIAGMISGGVMVFVWKFAVRPLGGFWDLYELGPAFLVSILFIVVVSLVTKAPSQEIQDEFEQVKSGGTVSLSKK